MVAVCRQSTMIDRVIPRRTTKNKNYTATVSNDPTISAKVICHKNKQINQLIMFKVICASPYTFTANTHQRPKTLRQP